MKPRRLVMLPIVLLIGCNTPPTAPSGPVGIELVSGGDQQGVAGYPLPQPVVVRVVDDRGDPLADVELRVTASAPLAEVSADSWITNGDGEVSFSWRMGASVDGEQVTVSAPNVPSLDPVTIDAEGGSREVRAIAGGLARYCVVTLDQRLGCWQPWPSSAFPDPPGQPPQITFRPAAEQFVDVAMGNPAYGFQPSPFGCAIRSNGGVACFEHEAGLESLADIGGTHPPLVQVFANYRINTRFFCALTQDGEAWCWGKNAGGQLGDGTTNDAAQPTRVDGAVRFTELVLGDTHACGLDAQGAAWCWGTSASGATGSGTFEGSQLTPTAALTPTRFAALHVIGGATTCGRTAQGTWWCWGSALYSMFNSKSAVPQAASFPAGGRLATPDFIALFSDPAGNAAWWGDLYPTLDLHVASSPRPIEFPMPVIRFLPKVRDMAACIDVGAGGKWLCVNLLWLASSSGPSWVPTQPLVHGVP